ncbi:MAG: hypothetical protein ABR964_07955 [Tepidisphaeraceae bacterium]|jgi:hypothetical protein
MPARIGLTKNIVYRIRAFRTGPLHEWMTKADLLNFPRLHAMSRDMLDPSPWPDEFPNRHSPILSEAIADLPLPACSASALPSLVGRRVDEPIQGGQLLTWKTISDAA